MPKRTTVYIDGFNLYYGCLRKTRLKWLDPLALVRLLLQRDHSVNRVRYFTARVSGQAGDPKAPTRQQLYLRALQTLPEVDIHYGHFLTHPVMAKKVQGNPPYVEVFKTEEKGSDVNLASYMLMDGWRDDYDCAVVVSNDSDLLTPIQMVKREFGKTVGILNPQKRASRALVPEADFVKSIRVWALKASQFPDQLVDANGRRFHKPPEWR